MSFWNKLVGRASEANDAAEEADIQAKVAAAEAEIRREAARARIEREAETQRKQIAKERHDALKQIGASPSTAPRLLIEGEVEKAPKRKKA